MTKVGILNPWVGPSSYQDPDKSDIKVKFCGRENETFDLSHLIDENFLVTLYGKSGNGKTSLLQAGVFPRLRREQYLPVMIRLGMIDEGKSFQSCIKESVAHAIEDIGGVVKTIPVIEEQMEETAADHLWNYFARHHFCNKEGETLFPVIVFDQFEEVLRSQDNVRRTEALLSQINYLIDESHALGDCIVNGEPYTYDFNFRFVISIREDELFRLEDCIDNIYQPALKRCRYRLNALSREDAEQIIKVPGAECINKCEQKEVVSRIIDSATNKEDGNISPFMLSLICGELFKKAVNEDAERPQINLVMIDQLGHNILRDFYVRIIAEVKMQKLEQDFFEETLVDDHQNRNSINIEILDDNCPMWRKLVKDPNRILQRTNNKVELVHDQLAKAIYKYREERIIKDKSNRNNILLWVSFIPLLAITYLSLKSGWQDVLNNLMSAKPNIIGLVLQSLNLANILLILPFALFLLVDRQSFTGILSAVSCLISLCYSFYFDHLTWPRDSVLYPLLCSLVFFFIFQFNKKKFQNCISNDIFFSFCLSKQYRLELLIVLSFTVVAGATNKLFDSIYSNCGDLLWIGWVVPLLTLSFFEELNSRNKIILSMAVIVLFMYSALSFQQDSMMALKNISYFLLTVVLLLPFVMCKFRKVLKPILFDVLVISTYVLCVGFNIFSMPMGNVITTNGGNVAWNNLLVQKNGYYSVVTYRNEEIIPSGIFNNIEADIAESKRHPSWRLSCQIEDSSLDPIDGTFVSFDHGKLSFKYIPYIEARFIGEVDASYRDYRNCILKRLANNSINDDNHLTLYLDDAINQTATEFTNSLGSIKGSDTQLIMSAKLMCKLLNLWSMYYALEKDNFKIAIFEINIFPYIIYPQIVFGKPIQANNFFDIVINFNLNKEDTITYRDKGFESFLSDDFLHSDIEAYNVASRMTTNQLLEMFGDDFQNYFLSIADYKSDISHQMIELIEQRVSKYKNETDKLIEIIKDNYSDSIDSLTIDVLAKSLSELLSDERKAILRPTEEDICLFQDLLNSTSVPDFMDKRLRHTLMLGAEGLISAYERPENYKFSGYIKQMLRPILTLYAFGGYSTAEFKERLEKADSAIMAFAFGPSEMLDDINKAYKDLYGEYLEMFVKNSHDTSSRIHASGGCEGSSRDGTHTGVSRSGEEGSVVGIGNSVKCDE